MGDGGVDEDWLGPVDRLELAEKLGNVVGAAVGVDDADWADGEAEFDWAGCCVWDAGELANGVSVADGVADEVADGKAGNEVGVDVIDGGADGEVDPGSSIGIPARQRTRPVAAHVSFSRKRPSLGIDAAPVSACQVDVQSWQ